MRSVSSIAPIILAAGDSRRMGFPKALLPLGAETFLTHVLGVLKRGGLPAPVVVLGKAAAMIRPHIRDWQADIRINPDPDRGQLSSIQLALSHLRAGAGACLIWPVDQPAVSEELVCELTRFYVASESLIVCPVHGGKRGHPAIFHRSLFKEFMDAPLKEGPKGILSRHPEAIALLPTDEPAVVRDIDTASEYESLTGESLDSALAKRGISPGLQNKFVIRKTGRSEV